ncbi:MAG: DinB family protein [Gemmatimonadetes bacterium]|nr:DinB family protein [Gemmatimonadota bacterium]
MGILRDLVRGTNAHIDPVAAVEDVPWEMAGRRAPGLPHSIWQLLGHLNYWIDFVLKRIEGVALTLPAHASESWPADTEPRDQAAWDHEVALLRTNLGQLEVLAEAKASTLARIADAKMGWTVESYLWLLVAHNSYHTGQIVQVRQALGAWPPARGSLTW